MRTLVLACLCSAALSGPRIGGPDHLRQGYGGPPKRSAKAERPALQSTIFRVRLETTKGPIVIEVHREWAPRGADRFHELVTAGYFDDNRFFRVVKGQWAQFGINGDPAIAKAWRGRPIPDDPRKQSNVRGMV